MSAIRRGGLMDSPSFRRAPCIVAAFPSIWLARSRFHVHLLFPLLLVVPTDLMGSPNVSIRGGADESGQNYSWTITNDYDSPIVFIEFPQYRAAVGFPPEGWKSELTNPRGEGGRTGSFAVSVERATDGIAPGESEHFRLQVTTGGAPRGKGRVLIRFADGTTIRIRAEVPIKESLADRNVSLIGLGLIFAVFLFFRVFKGRRPNRQTVDPPP